MKSNNLKRQRRKHVPLCYQKQNLSKSNSSISQLLSIGAYKKRINALVRNNRSLAVALQEARCEAAYQSSILKDYARDCNQIRFARLKLQGMAKSITTLVTDLHEVLNCLDVDCATDTYNLAQKNGHHEKMKIKVPTLDCIEEVPMLSSENGECTHSSVSEPTTTLNEVTFLSGETDEIQSSPPKCITSLPDDLDAPPVLFIEDSEDNHCEQHSRKSKSSRKCVLIGETSLTPELDIDFSSVMRKSGSSRRQTQLFPSARRSSRKSYCNGTTSAENATPERSLLPLDSILNKKLTSALMDSQQFSEDNNIPELHCEQQYSEKNKIPDCAFVDMKKTGSDDANSSPPNLQYTSKHITGLNVNLNMRSNVPGTAVSNNENTESNHTILFNDDMELTEILHPVQQITSGNSPTAVNIPLGTTDVQFSVPEKNEELNTSVKKTFCNDKIELTENSEKVAVVSKDMHLNERENEICDSVINDKICKNSSETFQCIDSPDKKRSVSPTKQSGRSRKNIKYKVFFSSSESESDSTPIKLEEKQNKSHKMKRDTVIFKPKSKKKASFTKENDESGEKCPLKEPGGKKELQNSFSVYDLDVSNSKAPAKKSKPKSKTKNSSSHKEIPKPLLQNGSVRKSEDTNYKFSRTESFLSKVKENQLLQNCNFVLEVNPTAPSDETVERNQCNPSANAVEDSDARIENRQSLNSPGDKVLSSRLTDFQHQEIMRIPKSEIRRVSFASTDVVCNFSKASESKSISSNKKLQRASKSVFEGLSNQKSSGPKDFIQFETNKPSGDITEVPLGPEKLFNLSEETEVYTFMHPSDTLQNTTKANEHAETVVSVEDDVKTLTKSSRKGDNLPKRLNLCHPTPAKKLKKSSNHRKFSESSPILKDVVNLEAKEENRDSLRRRTKVVCYKEPTLRTKMRK